LRSTRNSFFYLFLKFVQINYIFSDNVHILYIYYSLFHFNRTGFWRISTDMQLATWCPPSLWNTHTNYCFWLTSILTWVILIVFNCVICDVSAYTVTLSFCRSTWIRYQNALFSPWLTISEATGHVMSPLLVEHTYQLLFLVDLNIEKFIVKMITNYCILRYSFLLSLYLNQVPECFI
jgi:hypothetical protein